MGWKEPPSQRSYACNAEMLIYLREYNEWTQLQLAAHSGYSERLISKAEAGRPISTQAIAVLAESLSSSEKQIYPEDLISDPVQMAKDYLRAVYTEGKNIVNAIEHFLDADVTFRVAGDPTQIPFAGEHRGLESVRRVFDIFFSVLQAPADHDHTQCYRFSGKGNEVYMWGESWIHPIGLPLENPIAIAQRFVFQRGKLVMMEDIYDTLAGQQALEDAKRVREGSQSPR